MEQSNPENNFIDFKEILKNSRFLYPYKEQIGYYLGEQFLTAVNLFKEDTIDEALLIFDSLYLISENFFIHHFIRLVERIRIEESEKLLEELNQLDPNDFVENLDKFLYHLSKASLFFKQLDFDECLDECKTAINYIVDFSPIYLMIGDCLMIRNNYQEAIENYKKALKGNYKINNAKANMAYAYLMLHKNWKARKYFKQIVDEFPDNYKVQYNMALCYLRKKKYKLALEFLNRVEKINSNFSGLHLTRGGIYLKLKQIEKAKESLNKAVQFGSNNALKILEKLNK